ncbi:MAG: HDOD domain-containing protein [Rhodocyclales bacterium]|nr:HDOD domain-containing protein [Rhodocyclales bacterium]
MNSDAIPLMAEISDQSVLEVLEDIAIPACPEVVLALIDESRRPDADLRGLARLVGADVGIAASVLQMANAPFFGLRNKAQSLPQALSVLGLRNLLKVVYGVMLSGRMQQGSAASLERFWDRSGYKSIALASLAKHLSRVDADQAYTFGLFYDMGIALLLQEFADYRDSLVKANGAALTFTRVEDDRHRVNHAMAGAMLAREWKLPADVCWAVFYHHNFRVLETPTEYATPAVCDLIALGVLAEHAVARFLDRPDEIEWQGPGEVACAHFGLGGDDVAELCSALTPELEEARAYRGA